MNGWWQFPWAEQVNGNQPGDYVRAWRHVHDIFTQQGVTNATWVWNPNIASARTTPLADLYPGDDYVDWTGMDGYNWGSDNGNRWQSFDEVFGGIADTDHHNTYAELLRLAPGKPVMICEVATSLAGGDSGAWVRDALNQQLPNNFPQIRAVVWFDWNAGDPALSWPIGSSPGTQSAFAQSIASDYFAPNRFGDLSAGTIAPLGGFAQVAPSQGVAADGGGDGGVTATVASGGQSPTSLARSEPLPATTLPA
jgi:mannan endo-1,4-beta-mannosidase